MSFYNISELWACFGNKKQLFSLLNLLFPSCLGTVSNSHLHSFIHSFIQLTSTFSTPTMCHALFIHLKDKAKWMNKSMILQSCCLVTKSCLIPLGPHGLQPTRFLCPWAFPGKNTGVSCHFLLQGIFLTQELNLHLLHCRQILYHWPTGEALCKEKCYISNSSCYTTNWGTLK